MKYPQCNKQQRATGQVRHRRGRNGKRTCWNQSLDYLRSVLMIPIHKISGLESRIQTCTYNHVLNHSRSIRHQGPHRYNTTCILGSFTSPDVVCFFAVVARIGRLRKSPQHFFGHLYIGNNSLHNSPQFRETSTTVAQNKGQNPGSRNSLVYMGNSRRAISARGSVASAGPAFNIIYYNMIYCYLAYYSYIVIHNLSLSLSISLSIYNYIYIYNYM